MTDYEIIMIILGILALLISFGMLLIALRGQRVDRTYYREISKENKRK